MSVDRDRAVMPGLFFALQRIHILGHRSRANNDNTFPARWLMVTVAGPFSFLGLGEYSLDHRVRPEYLQALLYQVADHAGLVFGFGK